MKPGPSSGDKISESLHLLIQDLYLELRDVPRPVSLTELDRRSIEPLPVRHIAASLPSALNHARSSKRPSSTYAVSLATALRSASVARGLEREPVVRDLLAELAHQLAGLPPRISDPPSGPLHPMAANTHQWNLADLGLPLQPGTGTVHFAGHTRSGRSTAMLQIAHRWRHLADVRGPVSIAETARLLDEPETQLESALIAALGLNGQELVDSVFENAQRASTPLVLLLDDVNWLEQRRSSWSDTLHTRIFRGIQSRLSRSTVDVTLVTADTQNRYLLEDRHTRVSTQTRFSSRLMPTLRNSDWDRVSRAWAVATNSLAHRDDQLEAIVGAFGTAVYAAHQCLRASYLAELPEQLDQAGVVEWFRSTRIGQQVFFEERSEFTPHLGSGATVVGEKERRLSNQALYALGVDPDSPSAWSTELLEQVAAHPDFDARYYSAFLSHSSADKAHVRRIFRALHDERRIPCWLDEHQLKIGDDLRTGITSGIQTTDKLLLFCSRDSLSSWWVDDEVRKVLAKERAFHNAGRVGLKLLVPIDLDGAIFDVAVASHPWADVVRERVVQSVEWNDPSAFEDAVQQLADSLLVVGSGGSLPRPKLQLPAE